MNLLVLIFLALLWAGGSYGYSRFKMKETPGEYHSNPMSPPDWTLIGIGSGVFTAWLVRVVFVPYMRWGIGDLLILLILSAGFFFLAIPRPAKVNYPDALEILPNRYGVFHLRLEEGVHAGLNWEDHTLGELDLRKKNLLVLAITRGDRIVPFPKGPEMLHRHDDLLIFGSLSELGQ